jgi:enoyl-CoA hydratase/carnithine racemase
VSFEALQLTIDGAVASVTLSRPDRANRVDARLLRELADAAERIAAAPSVCLTLVRAAGPDFCAGWDSATHADLARPGASLFDPFGCIAALPCPVLASLQGAVLGAGLELALACDVRIAAENARFSLPDVAQGWLPLAGGSQRLSRIAGRAVATSMLLLGDELDAQQAYSAGLVSRVFAGSSLAHETAALARRITANGPLGLRYAKEAVQHGTELTLDAALRLELDLSVILQTTRDRAEGVQAFLEKRPPNFEGR